MKPDLCVACGGAVQNGICRTCRRAARPRSAPPRPASPVLGLRATCVRALALCGIAALLMLPMGWVLETQGEGSLSDGILFAWVGLCLVANLWLAATVWRLQAAMGSPQAWLFALLSLIPTVNLAIGGKAVADARTYLEAREVRVGPPDSTLAVTGDVVMTYVFGVPFPRHWLVGLVSAGVASFLVFQAARPRPENAPLAAETPVKPERYMKGAPRKTDLAGEAAVGLLFTVRAVDVEGGPVRGALVEVWHPSPDGSYPGSQGRGWTDAAGALEFRLVMPGHRRVHVLVRHPLRQDWAGTLDVPQGPGTVELRGARAFVQTRDGERLFPFPTVGRRKGATPRQAARGPPFPMENRPRSKVEGKPCCTDSGTC